MRTFLMLLLVLSLGAAGDSTREFNHVKKCFGKNKIYDDCTILKGSFTTVTFNYNNTKHIRMLWESGEVWFFLNKGVEPNLVSIDGFPIDRYLLLQTSEDMNHELHTMWVFLTTDRIRLHYPDAYIVDLYNAPLY